MKYQIISNKQLNPHYYKLILDGEENCPAIPGQFVMLKVSEGYDPLLRRPFGIHRLGAYGEIELIYHVVGKGTSLLSKLAAGTTVDLLIPLGNGFNQPTAKDTQALLVAGAIGVAPLLFLAEELIAKEQSRITLLVGGRTRFDILALDDFSALGVEVKVATEDGSLGQKGLVTDLLKSYLEKNEKTAIFACGPMGMLKAVACMSGRYNVPCQVSMEALMACGVGACQGCVIKVRAADGFVYKRVCKEGPVFEADEIILI